MARGKIRSVWLPIGTTTGTTTTTAVFQSNTVPYFHYTPCIPSGATSGTETLQFLLGANVTGLNLSVEVDAAAPAENGVLCGSCFGSFTAPRPERVPGWRQRASCSWAPARDGRGRIGDESGSTGGLERQGRAKVLRCLSWVVTDICDLHHQYRVVGLVA